LASGSQIVPPGDGSGRAPHWPGRGGEEETGWIGYQNQRCTTLATRCRTC